MAISPNLVSYKDLAIGVADRVGLCPDDPVPSGVTPWTADNQRKISRFLTSAARWGYFPPNPDVKWPGILTGKSIALTSGAFNISQVDYNPQFSLFSEDPRPIGSMAYCINATISGDLIYPSSTLGTVFAIYIPRPPEYTNVEWDDGEQYAVNDYVYYADTGRCYRCDLVPPVATVPTNTTYWTPQDCLKILVDAICTKAASEWQRMGGNEPESAAQNDEEATYQLDRAWMQAKPFVNLGSYNYLTTSTIVSPTPLTYNAGYWTALTGGTSTCLDSVVTANGGVVVGSTIETAIGGDAAIWQLTAGTAAEDGISVVRPDDYNASTNAVYWLRIS